uniref:Neur_chan_memb domain-containing protein n=1 Tax=Steinernema glaseri TaxID=37863 RepID=A0A1I7ZQ10_9BILA
MASMCNCSVFPQSTNRNNSQCLRDVRTLIRTANAQLWQEAKYSREYLTGADLYTAVILFLFASIIILLMVRAIKPSETLDDQMQVLSVVTGQMWNVLYLAVDKMSVSSTPAVALAPKKAYQRAASYHQFVPQIVVTSETHQISVEESSPLSAPFSSFDELSQHSLQSKKNGDDECKSLF